MCQTDFELFVEAICSLTFYYVDYTRKNMCLGLASNNKRIQATKSVSGGKVAALGPAAYGLRSAQKLDKGTINLPLGSVD